MIDKKSIGKIIKTLRTNKKLTQEELAEKVDISKNYLSKVERGLSVLNTETFLKMAAELEFSLDDFGIKTKSQNNEIKDVLIQKILYLSEKELKSYSLLLDTVKIIVNDSK